MTTIAENLTLVRARIQKATHDAGRAQDSVALLAVSKTFGPDAVRAALAAGQSAFGENYIQEALDKIGALQDVRSQLQWHCIGPIQSNKTRQVAEHFDWAHSVDRLKTAQRLSAQRPAHLAPLQVCIQVNVDGGATKSGVAPDQALALAREVAQLPRLCLRGLMSIPDAAPDFVAQKDLHMRTQALFDSISAAKLPATARWDTLSMGMSADLEAAVHAGSTLVRVGTAIFGGRVSA